MQFFGILFPSVILVAYVAQICWEITRKEPWLPHGRQR